MDFMSLINVSGNSSNLLYVVVKVIGLDGIYVSDISRWNNRKSIRIRNKENGVM